MKQKFVDTEKINPPTKKPVLFNLTEEASEMLNELTDNRSWLVEKLIRENYAREKLIQDREKKEVKV